MSIFDIDQVFAVYKKMKIKLTKVKIFLSQTFSILISIKNCFNRFSSDFHQFTNMNSDILLSKWMTAMNRFIEREEIKLRNLSLKSIHDFLTLLFKVYDLCAPLGGEIRCKPLLLICLVLNSKTILFWVSKLILLF